MYGCEVTLIPLRKLIVREHMYIGWTALDKLIIDEIYWIRMLTLRPVYHLLLYLL